VKKKLIKIFSSSSICIPLFVCFYSPSAFLFFYSLTFFFSLSLSLSRVSITMNDDLMKEDQTNFGTICKLMPYAMLLQLQDFTLINASYHSHFRPRVGDPRYKHLKRFIHKDDWHSFAAFFEMQPSLISSNLTRVHDFKQTSGDHNHAFCVRVRFWIGTQRHVYYLISIWRYQIFDADNCTLQHMAILVMTPDDPTFDPSKLKCKRVTIENAEFFANEEMEAIANQIASKRIPYTDNVCKVCNDSIIMRRCLGPSGERDLCHKCSCCYKRFVINRKRNEVVNKNKLK
jgi:hypothetical protein